MIEIARKAGLEVRVFEETVQACLDICDVAIDESTDSVIKFTKVDLPFGWLSNMSPHSILYKGDEYATAEALFQCLRFDDEQIQTQIWEQASPMAAKMKARKHAAQMVIEPRSEQGVENMGLVLIREAIARLSAS